MSYILDALKKSEEERRQVSSPPSIFSPKPALPIRQRNGFTLLLWGVLTIITISILLAAGYYTIGKGVISVNITVPQQTVSNGSETMPQDIGPKEPAPPRQNPAGSSALQESSVPPEQSVLPESNAPAESSAPFEQPATVAEEQPEQPKTTVELAKTSIAEPETTSSAEDITEPAPLQESRRQKRSSAPAYVVKIPHLDELDPAFRRTVPEFKLAGHVYSDDAGLRMIMINSQIAREKDVVAEGIVLEEIVPDGIILRSGSVRFRLDSN